jgi:hypothetical protein
MRIDLIVLKIFFFNSLYVFEINGEFGGQMSYDRCLLFIIFTIKDIWEFIFHRFCTISLRKKKIAHGNLNRSKLLGNQY